MTNDLNPKDLNSAALLRARVHPALSGLSGAGVIICVIDYGFDLLHPTLRTSTGETRFAAIIDQNGRRLSRSEINRLIRSCEDAGNRDALDNLYDAHDNYFGRDGVQVGAHGSWVASIAAGSRTAEFCGVAPGATLIGVQLDLPDSAWREENANGRPTWIDLADHRGAAPGDWHGWRSYEESAAIVRALEESYELARSLRPDGIVINLSIGAWAGGHDGGSPVNRAIDRTTVKGQHRDEPSTFVVTGTGNAGDDAGHVCGRLTDSDPFRFQWVFDALPSQPSKLEIWTDCSGKIAVDARSTIVSGSVNFTLDGSSHGTSAILTDDGQLIGVAEDRGVVRSGLKAVRILLQPELASPASVPSGGCVFNISVRPQQAGDSGDVHAWIERDCSLTPAVYLSTGPDETGLKPPQRCRQHTLTSIACAASVVSVAGLDNPAANDAALAMSGRGPRPWGDVPEALPSPLLAAPAQGLFGARSRTNGYMRGSGTSGAAAMVSGAAALALQAADIANRKLDHDLLAEALVGRASGPVKANSWRSDLGLGAMCFDASVILAGTLHSRFDADNASLNQQAQSSA